MNLEQIIKAYHDHLAPRLDTYEQAIYLYIFRHTRLLGRREAVIGFKSARRRMACGIGEKGKPMSEGTVYRKLQSLQKKGAIEIVASEREGHRIRLSLPAEIDGVIPEEEIGEAPDMEALDFFAIEQNRERIVEREGRRCFYCLREINGRTYVIEHVVSRPAGDSSYRNVVASCRQCNNRKGASSAEDWLRTLYREGFLESPEFEDRLSHLQRLQSGELKPPESPP